MKVKGAGGGHNTTPYNLSSGPRLTDLRTSVFDNLPLPPEWMSGAPCGQTDPDAFFPEKGSSPREAKKVCADCPFRAKHLGGDGRCLDYALRHDERYGVWGGVTERERRRLRRGDPVQRTICQRGHEYAKVGRKADGSCVQCRRDRNLRYDSKRRGVA